MQRDEEISGWALGRIYPTPDEVPEGWELVTLTDVAQLETGHTPSKDKPQYWNGDIPWVSLHDTKNLDGLRIDETQQTISPLGLANSSARLLPEGTVVFSRTATVGKATILGHEMATSQDFANYICGDQLHNEYLAHLFRFMKPEWERLMAGSTHNSIYMEVFRKLQILLPPLEEQKAIAEALSDVDALLASIDAAIEKKRNVKTATMQRLLTGEERLPGFKGEWDEYRVGDIFQFLKTANNPRRDLSPEGTVQYLHYGDLHTGMGPHLDCRDQPLPAIEEKRIGSADWIRDGDLVMADASEDYEGVGKSVEMRGADGKKVVAGLHTLLLRGREDALADGFKGYIQYIPEVRRKVRRIATGTSVYGLSKSKLRDVEISLPERDEQRAIAEILSDMDAEIEAWEKRRAKTEAVKTGMMQELLTGETRLV